MVLSIDLTPQTEFRLRLQAQAAGKELSEYVSELVSSAANTSAEIPGAKSGLSLREKLLRHAGTVPNLPPDLAEHHDHYLYGSETNSGKP
jgi:hypothetical protein